MVPLFDMFRGDAIQDEIKKVGGLFFGISFDLILN